MKCDGNPHTHHWFQPNGYCSCGGWRGEWKATFVESEKTMNLNTDEPHELNPEHDHGNQPVPGISGRHSGAGRDVPLRASSFLPTKETFIGMIKEGGKLAIMTGLAAVVVLLVLQEPGLALIWGPITAAVTLICCICMLFTPYGRE